MKEEGLTPEEKEEQSILRGKYLASVRENLRGQLNRVDIQNPDGTVEHVADRAKGKRSYEH